MAAREPSPKWREPEVAPSDPRDLQHVGGPVRVGDTSVGTVTAQQVREVAARLYAQGFPRAKIARILVDHLVTPETRRKPLEQKLSQARGRLRRWENQESFRDLMWKQGLIKLDMQVPGILDGVAKKAKRGRVDAARLVLEVTGRHNPKGEVQPAQIVLQVQGVPRPRPSVDDEVVDVEDAELVELNGRPELMAPAEEEE